MLKLSNCFEKTQSLIPVINKDLLQKYSLKNIMMVPRLQVIYLNVGAGKFFKNSADMEKIEKAVTYIACQKAVQTKARISVAAFNVREGMKTGVRVSLRGRTMYDFIDRLKLIYLARLRDFKGLDSNSFNGRCYNFGVKDASLMFPEVISQLNTYDFTFGMTVTFVFHAENHKIQKEVLENIGLPFMDSDSFE